MIDGPRLVAGIDSSTQSCKVVVRDARTGALVRQGRARHPDGTEVDPEHWWTALQEAIAEAGGLDDVAAISVGGQQHGMVCLDEDGAVVRPALLWNDTRSAGAARDLVDELGGPDAGGRAWADAVGVVPVASFTITKLRWLAEHEPEHARRTAAVCLPHDWLTWRLSGSTDVADLTTDRSDASGTGYWSAATGSYRPDLLERAFGAVPHLPRVVAPGAVAATAATGAVLGAGAGDNAAAALGLGAGEGDVVVSIGTSGVVTAVTDVAPSDPTGSVAGFADATGLYLPLVATLNGARVLDAAARLLDVDHDTLSALALEAPRGAGGLVLVPYLEGERTPNRPDATGSLHGLTLATATRPALARAAIEGLLCSLADGLDAVVATGVEPARALLVGGAAASEAVRTVAAEVLGIPVDVPPPGEYVADGAARQAAWALSGADAPPAWEREGTSRHVAEPDDTVRRRYAEGREQHLDRTT
ncbi:xylulokinase [Nocardioides hwasunensis]|uniref:Xylulose kinase n=1 Tax=Nocardioides hwasunensis TaxID=397258 RepID=A0ABR8MFF2_9ACTN|nr:xylulokinase [Nocardioides hwasunensis]MBD3913214.1 xylulokinase [Nocardioides hwasunensis]